MKIEKLLGGLMSLGMVAALAVPFALANSQATTAPQAAAKEMGMHHGGLQAAVESLNLTDDQKAKVKDIFEGEGYLCRCQDQAPGSLQ